MAQALSLRAAGVVRGLQGVGCGGHFSAGLWVCSGRSEYQVKGAVKRNKAEGVEGHAESVSYRSVGWCGSAQGVAKGPEWRAEGIKEGCFGAGHRCEDHRAKATVPLTKMPLKAWIGTLQPPPRLAPQSPAPPTYHILGGNSPSGWQGARKP